MHAWQPPRMAAVLTAAEQTGLTRSDVARIAGVHRSQVSRWFSGDQRPGYDAAMRIAGYLEKDHPELAKEFTEATGYGGPVAPGEDDLSDFAPGLVKAIRDSIPDAADRERVFRFIRLVRSGRLPLREESGERRSREDRAG